MATATSTRLLVVDDVEDNRVILVRRFTRLGYHTVEAKDGAEALELIEREPFDAVLLDIMMPEIDGLEVLRRVRESRSQAELPIIMVSAKAASEDVVEALLMGANDYITKPVDLKIAQARIEVQLARKRQEDASRAARVELDAALGALRQQMLATSGQSADGLGRSLDVAGVVARVCDRPELQDTVALIDAAVEKLHAVGGRAAPAPVPAGADDAGPFLRILSADGSAQDRHVVRMMLAETAARVELVEVASSEDAVAAVAGQVFDLVIVGLQLAGGDGLAAISEIRARELTERRERTPIVAVSAHADSAALAIKAGADLHLAKPVTAAALLNAVVRALSQGSDKLSNAVA